MSEKEQKQDIIEQLAPLRLRAEARLESSPGPVFSDDPARLAHELQVYRIELELQNEELRTANDRLQIAFDSYFSLFNNASVAFLELERTGKVVNSNLAASRLFGIDRQFLNNASLLSFIQRKHHRLLLNHLYEVFETQDDATQELKLVTKNRDVLLQSSYLHAHDGPGRCLMVCSDVSELRRANLELEASRKEALRNDKQKSQFLAMMSHEIRTPLSCIVAFSDLLIKENADFVEMDKLKAIFNAASHITSIISDILDLSKIESNTLAIFEHGFAVADLLDYATTLVLSMIQEKEIELRVNRSDTLPERLIGDQERYQQCAVNLLSNAAKFTPKGGVIEVSLAYRQDNLILIVDDSGPGIPENMRETIFRPYRQVDSSDTRNKGGTGLGLTISRRLARLMKGQLLLSESSMGGARFVLQAPFAMPRTSQEMIPPQPTTSPTSEVSLTEVFLLVVDDDESIRQVLKSLLANLGVKHDMAKSGREALTMLSSSSYDAVLLDMQMPEMSGLEVICQIRENPDTAHLRVAALTAKVMKEEIAACLQAGCNTHIAKPFTLDSFEESLRLLLTVEI